MTLPPGIVGTGSYDESVNRERLLAWRLANHHLAAARTGDPAQLVAHFGAVQAQEYGQSLWAVACGLRRLIRFLLWVTVSGNPSDDGFEVGRVDDMRQAEDGR